MTPYQLIFLNSAAYSGFFPVILTGQVSATSSLYVGLALGILSRGSTIFIGNLIESSSTLSLTETGFGFIVFFAFATTVGNGEFCRLPFSGFSFAGTWTLTG